MCGEDRDIIYEPDRYGAAWDGDRGRPGSCSADYLVAVKCAEGAVQLRESASDMDVFVGRVGTKAASLGA